MEGASANRGEREGKRRYVTPHALSWAIFNFFNLDNLLNLISNLNNLLNLLWPIPYNVPFLTIYLERDLLPALPGNRDNADCHWVSEAVNVTEGKTLVQFNIEMLLDTLGTDVTNVRHCYWKCAEIKIQLQNKAGHSSEEPKQYLKNCH